MDEIERLRRRMQELEEKMELVDRGYHQRLEALARRLRKLDEMEQQLNRMEKSLERHMNETIHLN
jgi:prefoldin subunit 5